MTDEYAESGEFLAMNMVGHLAPADRAALWRRIADRLAPGAPLVLNTQPPVPRRGRTGESRRDRRPSESGGPVAVS